MLAVTQNYCLSHVNYTAHAFHEEKRTRERETDREGCSGGMQQPLLEVHQEHVGERLYGTDISSLHG